MTEFLPHLVDGLGIIAIGVLMLAANAFRRWANERYDDGKYESAKDTVVGWVERTVDYLDQTVVEDLKANAADGDLTPEELKKLLGKVKLDALAAAKQNAARAIGVVASRDGEEAAVQFLEQALESYINRKRGE